VVRNRARDVGLAAGALSILLFAGGWAEAAYGDIGFRITSPFNPLAPSNPLWTATVAAPGAWLDNYRHYPWMMLAPVLGFGGTAFAMLGVWRGSEAQAFAGSSLAATGIIATVGLSMFPFILPSSIDPHSSLTVWNASSSSKTLGIMLIVTLIFLPIVLAYTAWAYRVMFGRVTTREATTNPDFY
jgi:cytochrome d ubiquinol oxidase subunit II